LARKLREAFGESICTALEDNNVVEVMLNPGGRLFLERLGEGIGRNGELRAGAKPPKLTKKAVRRGDLFFRVAR